MVDGQAEADGSDRHHHVMVTHQPWGGDHLLKRHRLSVVNPAGRISRFANTFRWWLCASAEAIAWVQRIRNVLDLPSQARAEK